MFTVVERDRVRERLLALARADVNLTAAAITGSYAIGASDEWSDIDLAFGVADGVPVALDRWTAVLYRDFGALHHWDLPWRSSVYRVFLLGDGLEVDIAFTPIGDFGPSGPQWRIVFGDAAEPPSGGPSRTDEYVGHGWHHVLHARAGIGRGRPWPALWLIDALRDQVIALACQRLGHPTAYAKGAHLLPADLLASLATTVVRSLDETELRRALDVLGRLLVGEVALIDPDLAARLEPILLT